MMTDNRRWRWIAPGVVGAAIAATALVTTSAAASKPKLPSRTAGQLLAAVQEVKVPGFSGTIVQTSRLGISGLPTAVGDATLSWQSFASGSRQLRIWQAGPDHQRVALLGQVAESDIVHNGRDVWSYSSSTRAVTHAVLPGEKTGKPATAPVVPSVTPQQAADQVLRAMAATTMVTVDRTARVAGRAAYQLVLTPRDGHTLVGSVQLALDSQTSLPLRVRIFARGGKKPAFEVGFTELRMRTPAANVFRFVPPAGTKVKQQNLQGLAPDPAAASKHRVIPGSGEGNTPRTIGAGWTSVLVLNAGDMLTGSSQPAGGAKRGATATLDRLTTRVTGGRLLTSALVSALIKDDGTVYIAALSGADLQKVAATGRPL
ncbi:MAG: hypothetical protein DLM59_01180 [Pseudonocardiales bacterium]|nr:MAG: hypothetical protein DLM59_01180 [Pseudonocardiales bacterium]